MDKVFGGEIVVRMLANEGVTKVFGIIDGTYFGLYSTFAKYGIEFITPRHEACAVHMAAAYARTTGKLGVCMASNGPGVANVLPGVAVENCEGNRVLLITSARRTGIGYPDRGGAYQYFNATGVTKAMTKWCGTAPSYDRIPEFMKRAFRIAWRGRPGVVHVDIPENLMNNKTEIAALPQPASYRRTTPIVPDPDLVAKAAEMLTNAELPIIHAGSGVTHAQASEELHAVAKLLHAPVCTSWAGRGAIPEQSQLAIPMPYVQLNNQVRNEADAVLTLGSRIGETDWWGKAPNWRQPGEQRHIQVDIDEEILGLNKPVDLAILGDVKLFLEALRGVLESKRAGNGHLPKRRDAVQRFFDIRTKERAKLDQIVNDPKAPLTAAHITKACQERFPEDAYLIIDGGNTAVWGNFYHEIRTPHTVLATPKMGMLGAGVAQTLGVKAAHPDRAVYCILGDGAFGFNQQEIETAVRNKLSVVYFVCADKQWGMVKINQSFALRPYKTLIMKALRADETINTDLEEIRYDKLAEAMGAHGERVSQVSELGPAIDRAMNAGKPAVVHCDVDPVKHMWAPSLLEFKKMHMEPKGK
ncbi:MAG: thiamine pyrophosphate-binding protein [Candidatus Hydrogenedentota bacterium]